MKCLTPPGVTTACTGRSCGSAGTRATTSSSYSRTANVGAAAGPLQPGEDPVVRATAPPQPHPACVHREPGQQHDLRRQHGVRAEWCPVRLPQAPPRAYEPLRPLVPRPVEVVVRAQHRQQDFDAPPAQYVEQHACAGFASDGDVRGDRTGPGKRGQISGPPRENQRGLSRVFTGQQGSRGEEFTPYGSLSGHLMRHRTSQTSRLRMYTHRCGES